MNTLREKGLLWIGMPLTTLVILFLGFIAWKGLINREATHYGHFLTGQIITVVNAIDQITRESITPDIYDQLYHKPLRLMDLDKTPLVKNTIGSLGKMIQNPFGVSAIFTDCPRDQKATCYHDYLFSGEKIETIPEDYNPKSRPWYVVTRGHTEWVMVSFLVMLQEVPTYPRTPGLGFTKRLVMGEDAADRLKKDPNEGIVFAVASPNPTVPVMMDGISKVPYLEMISPGLSSRFASFDVAFTTVHFPGRILATPWKSAPIHCGGITESTGFNYHASIQCFLDNQPIHYVFEKRYDTPIHFWLLLGTSILLVIIAYRFFHYVIRLQAENVAKTLQLEQGRLASAIGAKLVHDLKKGILWKLNQLYANREQEFPTHIRYIHLLNKYVALLGNNLRGERETHWVRFTPDLCAEYLDMILGTPLTGSQKETGEDSFLHIRLDDNALELRKNNDWPPFIVPEVSFFRIFKNIIENYHTHGAPPLHITMAQDHGQIVLRAHNAVAITNKPISKSSKFGLAIIQQLLADNFGNEISILKTSTDDHYQIELRFPRWGELP